MMDISSIIFKAIVDIETIEGRELSIESKRRLVEDMNSQICGEILAYSERDRYRNVWVSTTDFQKQLLKNASSDYGATINWWEENQVRQAQELVNLGYLSVEPASRGNRADIYFLAIPGRHLLKVGESS